VKRVSPSMAVSLLALFVALGGTGYAAAKLNGRNIVNRSIRGGKLAHNTGTGTQIRESSLGRVPSAADADFLDGRPASAYLLAGTGVAFNSQHLGGLDASAFLPVNGIAANSQMLQGNPAAAFLRAGATAANAAALGGRPASDFAPAEVAGPVTLALGASQPLLTHGPLTLTGECANNAGQPQARVTVQGAGDLVTDDGTPNVVSTTSRQRGGFTALSGASAVQGAATGIADAQSCRFLVYAFGS
jgi:hypothetical protein